MLQKIQGVFDSNFVAPRFISCSLKICIIRILETHLYSQARNAQTKNLKSALT